MTADAAGLQSLISLGIPRPRAAFALKEYGGDVEAAADWCFTVRSIAHPAQLDQR